MIFVLSEKLKCSIHFIVCKIYLHSNSHRFPLYFLIDRYVNFIKKCQSDDNNNVKETV